MFQGYLRDKKVLQNGINACFECFKPHGGAQRKTMQLCHGGGMYTSTRGTSTPFFIIRYRDANFYWRIFVIVGLGHVFFLISWIAQEFGFTRSGLTWESDKEEQKEKNIMDENNRKTQSRGGKNCRISKLKV